jgi:DNA-binding beta-propeller fold protein YncE
VTLVLRRSIELPSHPSGGFDHGDVHLQSGRVFLAHTAMGTVEVIDGPRGLHQATIRGCPEASGVLCAQDEGLVFAAARGAGRVMIIEAGSGSVLGAVAVGPRPNGLAWDPQRKRVLVADVQDLRARLVDPRVKRVVLEAPLPGRPRWCVYDASGDRFLVNIRDPAVVAALSADTAEENGRWPVRSAGPHGLDLDAAGGRAFVACDGGMAFALELATGREVGRAPLSGEPDAIWYHPDRRLLYVAIGSPGVIDVIDVAEMTVAQTLSTEEGAHTTAFDRPRNRLYVFLPRSCRAVEYEEQGP